MDPTAEVHVLTCHGGACCGPQGACLYRHWQGSSPWPQEWPPYLFGRGQLLPLALSSECLQFDPTWQTPDVQPKGPSISDLSNMSQGHCCLPTLRLHPPPDAPELFPLLADVASPAGHPPEVYTPSSIRTSRPPPSPGPSPLTDTMCHSCLLCSWTAGSVSYTADESFNLGSSSYMRSYILKGCSW